MDGTPDEDYGKSELASNQYDNDETLLDLWLTGASGLQAAATESFDVEEVPYSSKVQKTPRPMVGV